ncbi:metallophosphoesterase family protein [Paracraurococcus lichenis]|uniref:Metallophosphoesterase family protein n=1 Tax=Paracraurococcus lichenis TaxID=3064888 RepID=A0ABT9DSN4_9PROT|nr:metallophosphoesterase family protein [Paracraurococcus sp. LOR1-02]MDO9706910.1 metallophosphoesterase family protein [Paracraurococcus sp. LOR1-02]
MAVFFTSDTHFGHGGALGLYGRPFASIAAMDAAMVERWNATVGPEDEVWHLGDVALGRAVAGLEKTLAGLAGRKHLVTGNNDGTGTTALPGWASVQPYAELDLEGTGLVLCHYPFRSWRNMQRGWLNLHGHSHGRLAPMPRQVDVGVDAWDFRPVPLAEILARLAARRRRPAAGGQR